MCQREKQHFKNPTAKPKQEPEDKQQRDISAKLFDNKKTIMIGSIIVVRKGNIKKVKVLKKYRNQIHLDCPDK